MLDVTTDGNYITFGERFGVSFQRTLRIPDDGKTYPLPPSLGKFPIYHVEDYKETVPEDWVERGGVFIPMYQREALWIQFNAANWKPNAVKVGVGMINAISGKKWDQRLVDSENDYVVCPDQPWLDGINAGDGFIKQFVAMPLGMGYTVEGQVTGEEKFGGIQIIVYEPKPGKFPDELPISRHYSLSDFHHKNSSPLEMSDVCYSIKCVDMGLGAGGKMKQKIYPDEYEIDTWNQNNYGRIYIHIVNSMAFRDITGFEPPTTPISAKQYASYGFPWFDLYDEEKGDIKSSKDLNKVKTIKEMDKEKGFKPQQDDSSVKIFHKKIVLLQKKGKPVQKGSW
ncbi:hypothetical protein ACFLQZ_03925 [Acidobacteriota bacterium]